MNPILARSLRLLPPAWVLVPALMTTIFTIGVQISGAQSADTDADGHADEVEGELGSNPTDADSTPEHFALLWSCTDRNDNDGDGTRDFGDLGCRSAVPGSPTPTPGQTTLGAGSGSSDGSGSGGGSSSDSGGSSGSGDSGSGAGDSGSGGQDPGAGIGVVGSTSSGEGGSTSDGGDDASSPHDSGGGFLWMLMLLILAAVLTAASKCYALVARRHARSRSYRMTKP